MPDGHKSIQLCGGPRDGLCYKVLPQVSVLTFDHFPGGGRYHYEEEFPKRMTVDGNDKPTGCWAFRFVGLVGAPKKQQRRSK